MDETEEEMQARVEAEERARIEQEEDEDPQSISIMKDGQGYIELKEVAKRFGMLGAIAFGGPPAHVALMQVQSWRSDFVDDASFASLFALTQCLPGPSSTQLAIALGILMGGPYGGLVAFGAFSATATVTMTVLGSLFHVSQGVSLGFTMDAIFLSMKMGLAAAAVALVAKAAMLLSQKLTPDSMTTGLNVAAAAIALLAPGTSWVLPLTLVCAGLTTTAKVQYEARYGVGAGPAEQADKEGRDEEDEPSILNGIRVPIDKKVGMGLCGLWLGLLFLLGLINSFPSAPWGIQLMEPFYRTGSLVWGGGPVVLPLIRGEVVPKFVTKEQFLQGFAYVQVACGLDHMRT